MIPVFDFYGSSELSILTSRGCLGSCTYCVISGLYKGKWLPRSPESIIEEAKSAMKKQFYTIGFFVDDCFLADKKRALMIAKLWKENINIPFYFAARATDINKLSEDEMIFLRNSGCFRVEIGFESFSDSVLKRYGKMITSSDYERSIYLVQQAKIELYSDIILWDYDVTLDEIKTTLNYLYKYRIFKTKHIFQKLIPMVGTPIERIYQKKGIIYENDGILDYQFKNGEVQRLYEHVLNFNMYQNWFDNGIIILVSINFL